MLVGFNLVAIHFVFANLRIARFAVADLLINGKVVAATNYIAIDVVDYLRSD